MATLVKLMEQKDKVVDEVYDRTNEAEKEREREFWAVVKVQAWFRAQRIRQYLKFLHNSAVIVQKRWRGFLGRRKYREKLKDQVFQMKVNHFTEMAIKVQKVWRGFYTRKYIFNYHSRKRYLEGLKVKNEITRSELADFEEQQEQKRLMFAEERERKRLDEWARKNHHLISTEVQPGIFNSPYQPYPDEMEYHLRNIKPSPPQRRDEKGKVYDPACKRYDLPVRDPLPPIGPKPQGPFRDLREVQRQRYKPFKPSLRVETSFTSLEAARQNMKDEEWVTRLNDNVFEPFTKKSYPYESTLHQSTQFGHIPYGNKFFRHEYIDKFVVPQNFQTVVPPIPVFDKLNSTYSQGEV